MHLFLNVALVLMAVFVIAWASFRFGGWFYQVALEDERALRADLEKERNELKTNLDLAVGKARAYVTAEIHKKIFPWLAMLCAVTLARGLI